MRMEIAQEGTTWHFLSQQDTPSSPPHDALGMAKAARPSLSQQALAPQVLVCLLVVHVAGCILQLLVCFRVEAACLPRLQRLPQRQRVLNLGDLQGMKGDNGVSSQ
jgi:hypothetical protein